MKLSTLFLITGFFLIIVAFYIKDSESVLFGGITFFEGLVLIFTAGKLEGVGE